MSENRSKIVKYYVLVCPKCLGSRKSPFSDWCSEKRTYNGGYLLTMECVKCGVNYERSELITEKHTVEVIKREPFSSTDQVRTEPHK